MLSDKLFNLYRLQGPHPHIKIESETAEDDTLMIIQVLDDHLSLHSVGVSHGSGGGLHVSCLLSFDADHSPVKQVALGGCAWHRLLAAETAQSIIRLFIHLSIHLYPSTWRFGMPLCARQCAGSLAFGTFII